MERRTKGIDEDFCELLFVDVQLGCAKSNGGGAGDG